MDDYDWKKGVRILMKRSVVTGIPELLEARYLSRFIRVCVLISCLGGFLYYTISFLLRYWTYPTVMDVVVEYPDVVEIPAVTVCTYNGISANLFCYLYPELCSPIKNYTEFCTQYFYFCDKNYEYDSNITIPAISPYDLPDLSRLDYKDLGVRPEDLIESCELVHPASGSIICAKETKWVAVFDSMGLPNNCYALNSLIGNVSMKPYTTASKSYVTLKIKTEVSDTFYTSTPSAIQISVHNPRNYVNPFKKGISIKPCYNYNLFISKTMNDLLPYPYSTNCTDYLELWKARGGHGPLSQTQCREECLLNVSLNESNCADPFYVSYPNTAKICHHPASSSKFFKKLSFSFFSREDIQVAIEEYASLLSMKIKDGRQECTSVITLAFNRMEIKTFAYYPKYQSVELFGYIGGYLGVSLGISLLAVSDLLESFFLIIKTIRAAVRKRRTKKQDMIKKIHSCYHADSRGNFRLKIY
ncbi:uncharacterized protein NPIL_547601 [Nephila pilipes]|uniref:Uncharacterized protein n=1 Tax=Nephila pilipes TaxID=299642 RepID=A0A8X6Q6N5_NEPPI|nr:uncharacterized protein NPIL_547601 [Nephila pilipes]